MCASAFCQYSSKPTITEDMGTFHICQGHIDAECAEIKYNTSNENLDLKM